MKEVTLTQTIRLKNEHTGCTLALTRLVYIGHTATGQIAPLRHGPIFEGCLCGVDDKQAIQDLVATMALAEGEEYDLPVWNEVPAIYASESLTLDQINAYKVQSLELYDICN